MFYIFVDSIQVSKDVWIIGDTFLYDVFTAFMAICQQVRRERKQVPFLHDFYNVQFYFKRPLSKIKQVEVRIVNLFIKGLNAKAKLPKYIIVMLDKDFIESANDLL